jgi:hypothetical protein
VSPKSRALFTALALFFPLLASVGCASLADSRTGEAGGLLALYFPTAGGRGLRGEAEVALSAAGRTVSLPAVFQLRGPAAFRFDLLDPLDRPAAVLFPAGRKIVQYQPAAAAASAMYPFPRECSLPEPGAWVGVLTGSPQRSGEGGGWQSRNRGGGAVLARYGGAELQQEIFIGEKGGSLAPRGATWYCRGEPVLKLRDVTYSLRGGVRQPKSFDVLYLKQGLAMSVAVTEVEEIPGSEGGLLTPSLPGGVRWTTWELVRGQ